MMKIKFLLSVCLFFTCISFTQAQDYAVLLASYNSKVSIEDFKTLGKIEEFNEPPFFKYYLTGFNTMSEAEQQILAAKAMGFNYARVENLSMYRRMKAGCCSAILKTEVAAEEEVSLKNIFFDFDKSDLTKESIYTLANAVSFLRKNKDCTIELNANTDAKGTNEYNNALSDRRKKSASAYLVANGIAASRISGNSLGKGNPIAKNEDGSGQDLPNGRSLNRRVELVIKKNGEVVPIVKSIEVPADLK